MGTLLMLYRNKKLIAYALLVIGLVLGALAYRASLINDGKVAGRAEVQALWDKDKAALALAEEKAYQQRVTENKVEAAKQLEANLSNERTHHEELAKLRADLSTDRMLRGPRLCGPVVAGETKASRPRERDEPDPGVGAFPSDVERDIKSLIWEMEVVASTARSCQQFVKDNGMWPAAAEPTPASEPTTPIPAPTQ
jgi:hypothetical protein